ncbi:hypothetical protein D3C86_2119880 [compost metagenome]
MKIYTFWDEHGFGIAYDIIAKFRNRIDYIAIFIHARIIPMGIVHGNCNGAVNC